MNIFKKELVWLRENNFNKLAENREKVFDDRLSFCLATLMPWCDQFDQIKECSDSIEKELASNSNFFIESLKFKKLSFWEKYVNFFK